MVAMFLKSLPRKRKGMNVFKIFVKGDYYQNLIVETDRVRSAGLTFPNDFYFLAERKIFNYASVFIMLIEYVEGVELNDMPIIPEDVKAEIKASMEKLHALNMLSGDPHRGNFIVSKDGVRIIDLSGKAVRQSGKPVIVWPWNVTWYCQRNKRLWLLFSNLQNQTTQIY